MKRGTQATHAWPGCRSKRGTNIQRQNESWIEIRTICLQTQTDQLNPCGMHAKTKRIRSAGCAHGCMAGPTLIEEDRLLILPAMHPMAITAVPLPPEFLLLYAPCNLVSILLCRSVSLPSCPFMDADGWTDGWKVEMKGWMHETDSLIDSLAMHACIIPSSTNAMTDVFLLASARSPCCLVCLPVCLCAGTRKRSNLISQRMARQSKQNENTRTKRKEGNSCIQQPPAGQKDQSASPFFFLSNRPSPFPPQRNGKGDTPGGSALSSFLYASWPFFLFHIKSRVDANKKEGAMDERKLLARHFDFLLALPPSELTCAPALSLRRHTACMTERER